MKKALWAMAIGLALCAGGAHAQAPPRDSDTLPKRTIQLTAEEGHTIKEVVLKDMKVQPAAVKSDDVKIGGKIPPGVSLQTFPEVVTERVPQVTRHKFFVSDGQVVVVGPNDTVADILK